MVSEQAFPGPARIVDEIDLKFVARAVRLHDKDLYELNLLN